MDKFIFILLSTALCLSLSALLLLWFSPVILPLLPWAAKLQTLTRYLEPMSVAIIILIIYALAALFFTWYIRKSKLARQYYVWILATTFAIGTAVATSQFYLFENNFTAKNIIAEIREAYPKQDIDLYMYNDFEEISTTPYYFGSPAVIINWNSNDLWYGMHKEDSKAYQIKLEEFLKLPADRPIFVLMEKRRLEDFKNKSTAAGYTIWKNYGRRVIFYKDRLRSNPAVRPRSKP